MNFTHKPQDLLTIADLFELDIAWALEQRDLYYKKRAEAEAAKICSAEDDALLDARVDEALRKMDRHIQAMRDLDAPPEDWRVQRKKQAAAIRREIAVRATELKQYGVRTPIAQAREEVARRYGRASGPALKKWLVRNR